MKLISLSQGFVAQIDDEDFEDISRYNWYARVGKYTVYAATSRPLYTLFMHVLIMSPPVGFDVHHIDGNGLNNCKCNLDLLNRSEHVKFSYKRKKSKL